MADNSGTATLEITRVKAYIAMLIPHKIYVDDQHVGNVANGKTQLIEVSAGTHVVYVKQSAFVKTNTLSIDCPPDQMIRLGITQNSPLRQLLLVFVPFGMRSLRHRNNLILEQLP